MIEIYHREMMISFWLPEMIRFRFLNPLVFCRQPHGDIQHQFEVMIGIVVITYRVKHPHVSMPLETCLNYRLHLVNMNIQVFSDLPNLSRRSSPFLLFFGDQGQKSGSTVRKTGPRTWLQICPRTTLKHHMLN